MKETKVADIKPGALPKLPTAEELAASAKAEIEKWIGEDLAALRLPDGKNREVLPRSADRLGTGGLMSWGEIMREGLWRLAIRSDVRAAVRYPLIRTGEREEVPVLTRILVYARDGGVCRQCGAPDTTEIDHVIPWSAGGPDTSNNLRLLCQPCNQKRSNFWLGDLPRIFPVTAACDFCLRDHPSPHGGDKYPLWLGCPICMHKGYDFPDYYTPAWCGTCQAMSYTSDPMRLL